MPCRSGVFDAVLCVGVFPEAGCPDRRVLSLFEVGRVLRDKGLACFIVSNDRDREELRRLQASVQGFGVDRMEEGDGLVFLRRSRHAMRISYVEEPLCV